MTAEFQLSQYPCRVCQKRRYNDGLKCERCGSYENRNIQLIDGKYVDIRYVPVNVPAITRMMRGAKTGADVLNVLKTAAAEGV